MLIILAFANQKDAHLALLQEESAQIRNALKPLQKRDFIQVEAEESTTIVELSQMLLDNPDQAAIFHYGGHAGGDELLLEDGEANDKGLAKLLGLQKNLKLVFLNGCSTKGQVDALLASGVKAVIATSTSINDAKAKDFAISFYKALTYKYSIRRAFEFAKGELEMRYREAPSIEIKSRQIGLVGAAESDTLPWGLYVNPDFENDILDFRLPYYKEIPISDDILTNVSSNQYITEVLKEMCRYNKDIYTQMVAIRNGDEVKRDSSYYLKLVYENFPLVIGEQIRLLKQLPIANRDRLEQLVSTYIVTGQTLYYIMLSNLWDETTRMKSGSADQPIQTPESLRDFLKNNDLRFDNVLHFNFFKNTLDVFDKMKAAQMALFAPEFESLCVHLRQAGHDAQEAYALLEQMRLGLKDIPDAAIPQKCLDAEMAVASLLWEAAFLVGYEMFSVRDIEINFPRAKPISYDLDWGVADTNTTLFNDQDYRHREIYTNCDSVVMIAYGRDGDLRNYLNLSPFIIDKNTYHKVVRDDNTVQKNRLIDLFLYRYENQGIYYYATIRHNYFLALLNEKGTDIINTHMTLRDFERGDNITQQTPVPTFVSSKFKNVNADPLAQADAKPIFADLEYQFESFKTSFT